MIKKYIILFCILSCSTSAVYAVEAEMESQAEPREVSALKDPSEVEVATQAPSNVDPTPPLQEMQTFCPCALKKPAEVVETQEEPKAESLSEEPAQAEREEEYTPIAEVEEIQMEEPLAE